MLKKSQIEKAIQNNENRPIPNGWINKNESAVKILFTLIVILLCSFYLLFEWNRYQKIVSTEAIILAESVESLLDPVHITALSGKKQDLEYSEYNKLKTSLKDLVAIANPIRFVYLMEEREGNLIILIDSESPDSPNYSPPGQVFEEATEIDFKPFRTGKTVLTKPTTDRWGNWISALVPIKDPQNQNVIAVLGIDYSASDWYAKIRKYMIPDFVVVVCILILSFALLHVWKQRRQLKTLSKKLAYDEAMFHSIFDQAPIGIAILSDKSHAIQTEFGDININPMYEKILGRTSLELQSLSWPEITYPDDLQTDMEKFDRFKKGEIDSYSMEKRFIRGDGSIVWVNMTISPFLGLHTRDAMHFCLIEDISIRKQIETELRENERSKTILLSHLPGMAYRCRFDHEWTMLFVSAGCLKLTGYQPTSLINNQDISFYELIVPEYRELLRIEIERVLAQKSSFKFEYEIMTANGERKWVIELGEGVFSQSGDVEALEGIIIDISDRKQLEQTLLYRNEHDRWTGLYNRNKLENKLINDFHEAKVGNSALIGICLSDIELITAIYGFHYTQNLIKKIAITLSRFCSDTCSLYNTFWDRFTYYLEDCQDTDALNVFCKKISAELESLLKPERIRGGIGILVIDQDEKKDPDLLLKKLLIASETARDKEKKNFSVRFYDENIEKNILRKEDIKRELDLLSGDKQDDSLFLQFQPILNLYDNRIGGFEALSRIKSKKLGLISPMEFVPIAEETKFIIPIGWKIFRQSFQFLNQLIEAGFSDIVVSVNVSVIQLLSDNFVVDLLKIMQEMGINPKNTGIEITESVFASDYTEINQIFQILRDIGIHIAIDDFGTGYSSFARELELFVNCLKIDKFFIDKLLKVNPDQTVICDIISMAHKMGHCTIAEGVEDERQLQFLKNSGCDRVQGYLIAKPLHPKDALDFIRNYAANGIMDEKPTSEITLRTMD